MVRAVLEQNLFYKRKLEPLGYSAYNPPNLADLVRLPFTTKRELVEDQARHPPYGSNPTFPLDAYTRIHQTSGTTGQPLRCLDTPESWQWWLDCWKQVYEAAGVSRSDRVFVAFSFGPFIGFWAAFEAAQQMGALTIPGGGLSSLQRLRVMRDHAVTVLVCTPTYALRLAEVAREQDMDVARWPTAVTIHAGEPGASLPNVKARIEEAWGARCVDHAGATEVGAWGYTCGHGNSMHINEREFVAEVVDPDTGSPAPTASDGAQVGELVLTNLGRLGSPVIRYRTGDRVELVRCACSCGRDTVALRGGVLGRVDDMVIVRGVNVYPTAVENVVREFQEIVEFEAHIETREGKSDLTIRIETVDPDRVSAELAVRVRELLHLRPVVEVVEPGSLPRYELKARRFKIV